MTLRIVFFNRSFYPDITATGQLLTELCLDLANIYKCQVTVITGRPLVDYGVYSARRMRGLIEEEEYRL
ncbi:MAG TPA: hypothetical protein VMD04_00535, partial [Candidatus Margulisiibacteriota bacterium]|nr:hypothetical protein [Candidatus Margulisiibacteriota bacterium]